MGDYKNVFNDQRLKFASLWFDKLLFEDLWNSEYVTMLEFMGQWLDGDAKPSFSETVAWVLSQYGARQSEN